MCIDTPTAISASLTCIITVHVDRFENRFTYKKWICSTLIQHVQGYYGVSILYLLHNLWEPVVIPGGEGLYRNCTAGFIVEDPSFEVDCTLPEEPVRVSWGVGRTSQLEVQSQNYAFMHFSFTVKKKHT